MQDVYIDHLYVIIAAEKYIQWTLSKPDPYGTRKICWFRQSAGLGRVFFSAISRFGIKKSILFRQISGLDRCRFGQSALY